MPNVDWEEFCNSAKSGFLGTWLFIKSLSKDF